MLIHIQSRFWQTGIDYYYLPDRVKKTLIKCLNTAPNCLTFGGDVATFSSWITASFKEVVIFQRAKLDTVYQYHGFSNLPHSLKEDLSQSGLGESSSVPANFFYGHSTVVLGERSAARDLRVGLAMGLRLGRGQLVYSFLVQRALM